MKTRKRPAPLPESPNAPHGIVIGDGWAALATVGFLVQGIREKSLAEGRAAEGRVVWIAGTGTRMQSALPGMETGPGVEVWARLARGFGIDPGEPRAGNYLREFRNKAFREPLWNKAPNPEARKETIDESLWSPERTLVPLWETRFAMTVNEIEAAIRALLLGDSEEGAPWRALIRRVEGLPVSHLALEGGYVRSVRLASGEEIAGSRIYYADRWADLPGITGLPKNLAFIRRREPTSLLQATLTHAVPVGSDVKEGFFNTLHKESGEEFERHLWGHFSSDGAQSYWTLGITHEEVEDNHQIAKKLRRLKSGLDKMFTGSAWIPEGKADFMENVRSESVRFQESVLYAEGEPPTELVQLPEAEGLCFLTDGYGPSSALQQAGLALGLSFAGSDTTVPEGSGLGSAMQAGSDSQAERVNLDGPVAS